MAPGVRCSPTTGTSPPSTTTSRQALERASQPHPRRLGGGRRPTRHHLRRDPSQPPRRRRSTVQLIRRAVDQPPPPVWPTVRSPRCTFPAVRRRSQQRSTSPPPTRARPGTSGPPVRPADRRGGDAQLRARRDRRPLRHRAARPRRQLLHLRQVGNQPRRRRHRRVRRRRRVRGDHIRPAGSTPAPQPAAVGPCAPGAPSSSTRHGACGGRHHAATRQPSSWSPQPPVPTHPAGCASRRAGPPPTPPTSTTGPIAATPNLAVVEPDGTGRICVTTRSTTHVVVDLFGVFEAGAEVDRGAPRPAVRLAEQRQAAGGRLGHHRSMSPIPPVGWPDGVVLNITARRGRRSGLRHRVPVRGRPPARRHPQCRRCTRRLQCYNRRPRRPGRLCVYAKSQMHVVVDLMGSIGAPFAGLRPVRVLDTRR